jgi:ubiquinone biosynthesis protein Coq4
MSEPTVIMQLVDPTQFNAKGQGLVLYPLIKGFKSFLAGLAILKSSLKMVFGNNSLETVGELTWGLLETPAYDLAAQHLKRDPACAELIRERYIPGAHDLNALLALPSDSLGYIYAKAMTEKGFDPNLHAGMTAGSDGEYIELRLSQTHDIWHIITGFDVSLSDEIGLQAFHLAQFPYPLGTMLVANTLISATLTAPETLPELLEAIAVGFRMGKIAKPLFGGKWEEGWEKPLSQWQRELNIEPIAKA